MPRYIIIFRWSSDVFNSHNRLIYLWHSFDRFDHVVVRQSSQATALESLLLSYYCLVPAHAIPAQIASHRQLYNIIVHLFDQSTHPCLWYAVALDCVYIFIVRSASYYCENPSETRRPVVRVYVTIFHVHLYRYVHVLLALLHYNISSVHTTHVWSLSIPLSLSVSSCLSFPPLHLFLSLLHSLTLIHNMKLVYTIFI